MSNAIGGIGGNGGYSQMMMQSMQGGGRRPQTNASEMAGELFAKLDTKGQGYIQQSDLESAMSSLSSSTGNASASEVFKTLDGNSDGKLTQSELTASLKQLEQNLNSQFDSMRMGGQGEKSGMPPPPPPPGGEPPDLTQSQLNDMASALSSIDSQASAMFSNLASNFDQADANGDGKVSAAEAMAFNQTNPSSSDTRVASGSEDTQSVNAQVMNQIMRLIASYGLAENQQQTSTLSLTA
ncbi:MAG: EF-hand domain-containing protein [Gallionellaceae bacterium]|nr:EF-hand domain-containing protein [Gallionellaceae bacterium]